MNPNTGLTLDQAISQFRAGKLIAVAEYRSSRAEAIKWRDKETQRMMSGVTLTHSLELDGTTAMLSERVPDDFDTKAYVAPFTKGDCVLVHIDLISKNKGIMTIYGSLETVHVNGNGAAKPAAAK